MNRLNQVLSTSKVHCKVLLYNKTQYLTSKSTLHGSGIPHNIVNHQQGPGIPQNIVTNQQHSPYVPTKPHTMITSQQSTLHFQGPTGNNVTEKCDTPAKFIAGF